MRHLLCYGPISFFVCLSLDHAIKYVQAIIIAWHITLYTDFNKKVLWSYLQGMRFRSTRRYGSPMCGILIFGSPTPIARFWDGILLSHISISITIYKIFFVTFINVWISIIIRCIHLDVEYLSRSSYRSKSLARNYHF